MNDDQPYKKPKPLLHQSHPRPVTRREFLAQGFIDMTAVMTLPSMLSVLSHSSSAMASETICPAGGVPGLIPFIGLDLAGGAALPGNFIVGGRGGAHDYLPSYNRMGVTAHPSSGPRRIDNTFGAPFHASYSKLLEGLKAATSLEVQQKTTIVTILHHGQDDSADNPFSPLVLIERKAF